MIKKTGIAMKKKIEKNTQKNEQIKKSVFIVHGHDNQTKQTVSEYLKELGLKPVILSEQPDLGKTIIEKVEFYLDRVSFAVVLLTGDDIGGEAYVQCDINECGGTVSNENISDEIKNVDRFKDYLEGEIEKIDCYRHFEFACEILRRVELRSRQNVIFELGITIGHLGRDKVRVLYEEGVELPSDIHGLVHIPLNSEWKKKILQELIAAKILDEKIKIKLLESPINYLVKMEDIPQIQLTIIDFTEKGWEAQTPKRVDTPDSDWQYWDTFLDIMSHFKLDSIIHRYKTIDEAKKGFSDNKQDYAAKQIDGRLFAPAVGEESYGYISSTNVEVATFRTANLLVTTCFYVTNNRNSIRHAEQYAQIIDQKIRRLISDNSID